MNVFSNISVPKVVYETDSQYNGHIQVIEAGNTKRIVVDKITQSLNWSSPSVQRRYWGKLVELLAENQPNTRNILLLGLGGGTLVHLLSKKLPEAHIVSVEIDPTMIEIAKNYFDLDTIPNHTVVKDDACRFIVEHDRHGYVANSFDVIIVDIYVGEKFPELGKSGNFIAALKNLAVPGGLIIFNRIYHNEHHQSEVHAFIDTLDDFLGDIKSVIVAGITNSDNVIILGRSY